MEVHSQDSYTINNNSARRTKEDIESKYVIKPKVTIGVCVRNCENLIKEAINSIVDQDFPHGLMEVIFVDDGSEDKTLSIIKCYVPKMDMKVKVFHQEWNGLGYARNVVVNNANGEYIIWVDCDMRLSRGFVRKQVEFMERNPNVGIGKGRYGMDDGASARATCELAQKCCARILQRET